MKKTSVMMMALVAGFAATAASAQSFTAGGPFNSDGADGDASNGLWSFTYTGATGLGTWTFSGTATSGGVGSYRSELGLRVLNVNSSQTAAGFGFVSGSSWTGGVSGGPVTAGGLWNMSSGDTMNFLFWEDYDDSGVDATWTNVTATFAPYIAPAAPSSVYLGAFGTPAAITMTSGGTTGSDTVLALFDSQGILLGTDDDAGPGAFSLLTQNLGVGTYYIGVVDYSSAAGTSGGASLGFTMIGGTDAIASLTMTVTDGSSTLVSPGETLPAGAVQWYSFTIPTPGAGALMACGVLVAARRRRA